MFQALLLLGAKHLLFQADAEDLERIERKFDAVGEAVGAAKNPTSTRDEPGSDSAIQH